MTGGVETAHSLDINVYSFSKRTSSTKLPTGGSTLSNVVLKTPCSRSKPVLLLESWNDSWNYVYIPEFSRYYWVTDIDYTTARLVTVSLNVDLLATYRSQILSSNQYVVRSTNNYDTSIIDTWYPYKSGRKVLIETEDFIDKSDPAIFCLGVTGPPKQSGSAITGSTQYALMSISEMGKLMKFLFDADNFTQEITDDVVKTFFNPFQYVTDCMFFPFTVEKDLYQNNLKLGWFEPKSGDEPVYCTYVDDTSWNYITLQTPVPKPIADNNDFRNYPPYTSYRVYIPYFGWTELNGNYFKEDDTLDYLFTFDYPTGTLFCEVRGNPSARVITTLETQCATKIPLAQVSYTQNIVSAIGAVGGAISEGISTVLDLVGFDKASDTVSGIGDALGTGTQQVSSKGQMGCIAQVDFIWKIILECTYSEQVSVDRADFGSPCCKNLTLSSISGGFCKCLNAHLQISTATETELNQLETLLNGGIYLE